MSRGITLRVNGVTYERHIQDHWTLLDVLRTHLGLTGAKKGCDSGVCGACSVHIDGRLALACLTLAAECDGRDVTTVEGLARSAHELHPLQASFIFYGAIQCGICTPGMLMAAKVLYDCDPRPTREAILHAMGGNICRCTGYAKIVHAVERAHAFEGSRLLDPRVLVKSQGEDAEIVANCPRETS